MGTLEYFEHTADVGLRATGCDLSDLFATLARGLLGYVVANPESIRPKDPEWVQLEADSAEALLAAWLNELIFRAETRHRVYATFEVAVDPAGTRLEGDIGGEPIDPERHLLDHEVKAATQHGLLVEKDASCWRAEVILDI